jgi:hypothetical protein
VEANLGFWGKWANMRCADLGQPRFDSMPAWAPWGDRCPPKWPFPQDRRLGLWKNAFAREVANPLKSLILGDLGESLKDFHIFFQKKVIQNLQ